MVGCQKTNDNTQAIDAVNQTRKDNNNEDALMLILRLIREVHKPHSGE